MARRVTAVSVLAAGLAAVGTPALLAGCAKDHGGSRALDNGVEYTIVVHNESKRAVNVSWLVGWDATEPPGYALPTTRTIGVIEPGATGRDGPVLISLPPPAAPEAVGHTTQVVRVLVTIPSPSWQDPARMWWEVVGLVPGEFVIKDGPGPDGFAVKLLAPGSDLEAVPRQFWGDEPGAGR